MRTLNFYLDRANGVCVKGLNSSAQVQSVTIIRNDTIQIVLHSLQPNPAVPALTPYVEASLNFNSARVSIGTIDTPPASGSFCLQVNGQTTEPIQWPADTSTPEAVAAFKQSMITALLALSNVGEFDGAPAVSLTDPEGAPAHFNYFTWADPTRNDSITVVNNRLLPLCLPKPKAVDTPVGYTQLLKFTQAPVAMCIEFSNPMPPVCTIMESIHGGAGANEAQILVVPGGATGGVAFVWSGATTATLDVTTITDSAIAAALNAVVANGTTNPSFTCTETASTADGQRFAIGFTGPLAGAAQPLLGIEMIDQVPLPYATGILDLSASEVPIDEDLDGSPDTNLTLEIVLDTPSDETYLLGVDVEADMTDVGTAQAVEQAGAVLTITNTVYLQPQNGVNPQPVIEAAPGCVWVPTVPVVSGQGMSIPHNLNTIWPGVRVMRKTASSPDVWTQVPDDQYEADATDANDITITFGWALLSDPSNEYYFGNFKIFITSPDAQLLVYNFDLSWDQVLSVVPGGESVRQKFEAIDAALGILNGNLSINAANITGLISASQLDLNGLGTALAGSSTFLSTLQSLITNATLLNNLFNAAATNSAFIAALTSIVQNSAASSFLSALTTAQMSNSTFTTALNNAVSAALQGSAVLPAGMTVLYNVPNVVDLYPSPRTAPSAASSTSAQSTTGSGGSASLSTASATPTPAILAIYQPLPKSVAVPVNQGIITGDLPLAFAGNAGWYYTVSGSATARTVGQRRGLVFRDGTVVVSDGNQWYEVFADSGSFYPACMNRELFTLAVRAEQIWNGCTFAVNFPVSVGLLGGAGGQYRFRLRTGSPQAIAGGGLNFANVAWNAPVIDEPIILTDVTTVHTFGYSVTNNNGALSATKRLYANSVAATAPGSANFVVRASLECFDVDETDDPCASGAVALVMTNARASIMEVVS